jgi:hypothetical protein
MGHWLANLGIQQMGPKYVLNFTTSDMMVY